MIPLEKRVDLLRIIAHPIRIKILEDLTQGVKCVSDFEDTLDISQPNVSQHLTLLRSTRSSTSSLMARLKCYFLKEPLIPDLLELFKKEYEEDIPAPACCPVTKKGILSGRKETD